jgi:hypothetical protein
MRRTGARRGPHQQLFEKIKVFFKNQKHEPNIVEVTHMCIMHKVHTSYNSAPSPTFFSTIKMFHSTITPITILYIKANMVCVCVCVSLMNEGGSYSLSVFLPSFLSFFLSVCSSVCQSFRPSVLPSSHCLFPVGSARGRGGGMSEEGPSGGELDGCIMHRVHASYY